VRLHLYLVVLAALLLSGCTGEGSSASKQQALLKIELLELPETLYASRTYNLKARITNLSDNYAKLKEISLLKLAYHWSPATNRSSFQEGLRSPIFSLLERDKAAIVNLKVTAPAKPGQFFLLPGALEENKTWLNVETREVEFKVLPWNDFPTDKSIFISTGFKSLDKSCQLALRVLQENIWHENGEVRFSTGAIYPDAWLRDFYWSLPALKWLVPQDQLKNILETCLSFQLEDGQLVDFRNSFKVQKNDVLSDHEIDAILAASLLNEITPDLQESPALQPVTLARLEKALEWLWRNRLDPQSGMITSGHIADWGDVEFEQDGGDALRLGPGSNQVTGIYHQAMAVQAAERLASLLERSGQTGKSQRWLSRASSLRDNARKLWSEKHGHFLIHQHTTNLNHDFNEDSIFALAGNTQALRAGLASEDQIANIIAKGVSSPFGRSLTPSYPPGFFKHHYLDQKDEYQNGGIWIWHASQFILEEFRNGYSQGAVTHLLEFSKLSHRNRDFHEWHTPAGKGMGSNSYAVSAASFLDAVISGYFGIELTNTQLTISPRLAEHNGRLTLSLPGQKRMIHLVYQYSHKTVQIRIRENLSDSFKLRCLLAANFSPAKFSVNNQKAPFILETIGEEKYLVAEDLPMKSRIIISAKQKNGRPSESLPLTLCNSK
jgi:hypothetical protein